MNIRKQNADEHTVMGYASACVCTHAVTVCGCSTMPCVCACQNPNDGVNTSAAVTNFGYDTVNSGQKAYNSSSSQSRAIS